MLNIVYSSKYVNADRAELVKNIKRGVDNMPLDYTDIGDRIEIQFKNRKLNIFKSMLDEVIDNKTIRIHMPIVNGQYVKLPRNEKFILDFINKGGICRYEAIVVGYSSNKKNKEMKQILMEITSKPEKIQRRQFYRLNKSIMFTYSEVDTEAKDGEENNNVINNAVEVNRDKANEIEAQEIEEIQEFTVDISGGGFRFFSVKDIKETSILMCKIMIDDNDAVAVSGKIVNKKALGDVLGRFEYRVQYLDIDPEVQSKIVHYIFLVQQKLMKAKRLH